MARRSRKSADRSLIQRANLLPNNELDVALLMQENDEDKRERSKAVAELAQLAVATVKACLAEARHKDEEPHAAVASDLRSQFAKAIDGSRFRAMWDLGDAAPIQIAGTVAKLCLGDLVELQKAKILVATPETIETGANVLIMEAETRHGVTHVAAVVEDPRQGRLL